MNNRIIVASNNKHKIREIKSKFEPLNIEVISQSESGYNLDVEETGTTFKENAILKARALYEIAKKAVMADDSGLEVDALNGEPGVYSARYCGPNATNEDKYNKVLELLKDVEDDKRTARFVCVICYIDDQGVEHIFEGKCEGKIARAPQGQDGFGYDPIFEVNGKSFAEISEEEKNKISHRGLALNQMIEYFKNA